MASSHLSLATINARTLSSHARLVELESALEKITWDVVGVTEARMVGVGSVVLPSSQAVIFHSGGATAHRGVAFVVRRDLVKEAVFEARNDRMATLWLEKKKLAVVVAYAPTSAASDAEYERWL